MIGAIEDYLRSPEDYLKGVELYRIHGKSQTLLSLFLSGESSYTREKLSAELQSVSAASVSNHPPPVDKIPPVEKLTAESESKFMRIDVSALPEDLKEKSRHKDALFHQAKMMIDAIRISKSDAERYTLALPIVTNFAEIDLIWKELEDFQLTGKRKASSANLLPLDALNALEISQQLKNVEKRYYKVSKDPKKEEEAQSLLDRKKELEDALSKR
jgi:hypothetical protein